MYQNFYCFIVLEVARCIFNVIPQREPAHFRFVGLIILYSKLISCSNGKAINPD